MVSECGGRACERDGRLRRRVCELARGDYSYRNAARTKLRRYECIQFLSSLDSYGFKSVSARRKILALERQRSSLSYRYLMVSSIQRTTAIRLPETIASAANAVRPFQSQLSNPSAANNKMVGGELRNQIKSARFLASDWTSGRVKSLFHLTRRVSRIEQPKP